MGKTQQTFFLTPSMNFSFVKEPENWESEGVGSEARHLQGRTLALLPTHVSRGSEVRIVARRASGGRVPDKLETSTVT